MTDYILRNLKENGAISKKDVISAAAKTITEDIRRINLDKDFSAECGQHKIKY